MGNPTTVPIFDPKGTLRDVPFDQLKTATASGGTIAHPVKAPDGTTRMVPVNRLDEAVKNGGTILPMDQQFAPQHPGFWQNLYGDLAGMVKGAPQAIAQASPLSTLEEALPSSAQKAIGYTPIGEDIKGALERDQARKAAGRSAAYRALAPVAERVGANVQGMEQSAEEGDVSGVAGHAAAVPVAMAATEGVARGVPAAVRGAGAVLDVAKPTLAKVGTAATAVGDSLDPDIVGLISPRAAHALRLSQKVGRVATKLGETSAPEPPPARTTTGIAPPPPRTPATPPELSTEPVPPSERTLSGDSALRKILTGQDNANLMKIAKSRGINVARESQLKPGAADNLLINKIVDDFQPEELDELRDRYIESTRFRHDFGDIGPDAWKTLGLQNYFPDLKLPKVAIAKTHAAILKAAANRIEQTLPAEDEDLTPILTESLRRAKAGRP